MKTLRIGQLAKTCDVKVETIRYYERRGLMPKPTRRESGYRQFSQNDVVRLRFIKRTQSIGFTLNEITEMLALKREPEATCGDIIQKVDRKLSDVEEKIKTLLRIKMTLIDLKKGCKKPNIPSKDCPILESLDAEAVEINGEEGFK